MSTTKRMNRLGGCTAFIKTAEYYHITQEERDKLQPIIENEFNQGIRNVNRVIGEYKHIIKSSDNLELVREYKLRNCLIYEKLKEQSRERCRVAREEEFMLRIRSTYVNDFVGMTEYDDNLSVNNTP